MKTEVEVIKIKNATEKEKEAFILAAKEFEYSINHSVFWSIVSNQYASWLYDNGLSFEDFKDLILSGRDKFENKDDYNIRIDVTFYYSRKKVVGYTYPSTWLTWINRNVFKGFNIADIAGNQAHEALHNFDFSHPGANRMSVPYQFGYAVRDFVSVHMNLNPVIKRSVPTRGIFTRVLRFFRSIF